MTIEARLADGRILRFPDGTPKDVVQSTVRKIIQQSEPSQQPEVPQINEEDVLSDLRIAQATGDIDRVGSLLGQLESARKQRIESLSPEQRSIVEDVSPGQAALIGAGRGLTNIGRAVGLVDPEPQAVTESIEALRQAQPILTAGEVAGEAAPFLPLGLAAGAVRGTAARVGASTGVGALEGGLIARGSGQDVEQQIGSAGIGGAVAGGLELALPVVGRIGGKIIRRVTGKSPTGAVIDASGNPSEELVSALNESGVSFDDIVGEATKEIEGRSVNPRQAARAAFFRSQGLEPTRAQVTRNAADFQLQQESAKTSGRVRDALENQDAILTSRFDDKILETEGNAFTPTASVFDAITEKATVLDQNISDLYRVARDRAPLDKNVRFNSLSKNLKKLAPSDRASGGAVRAIVGDLQNKGVLDRNMNVVGRVSVETAEDTRKLANELFDPGNPFRNGILRNIKDSLDDDVFKSSGDDVFKEGRKAKADFEKELSRAKISKFDKRNKNIIRDILENKIDPDRLVDDVVFSKKWRPEDLQQVKSYISESDSGSSAFNDLRAEVLQSIKEKSFIGAADEAGNRALSRDKLQKAMNSIGSNKMKVIFTPEENKFLKDLLEITKLREPVRGTAIGRGPTGQAVARLEKKITDIPVLGALVNFLDIDATGRLLVKGNPDRLKTITAPSQFRGAAGAAGAAALSQDRENQ
jgi:hypothetical protein